MLPGELEGYAVPWWVPREFFTQDASYRGWPHGSFSGFLARLFEFHAGSVVPWVVPREVFFLLSYNCVLYRGWSRGSTVFLIVALLPLVCHVKYNGTAHYCAALRRTKKWFSEL